MSRYEAEPLQRWCADVLAAEGVCLPDATLAAQVLVRTSLRGVDTHGVSRLPAHADKLRSGEVHAGAVPRVHEHAGALLVDGEGGLGQVVATRAVDEAVRRSDTMAAVACSIRNSGHLSALGPYVLEAAEQGRVAFLCQRTPPIMATRAFPPTGRSAPTGRPPPIPPRR
jgi:LDH2 family malate/lactate/ureidoglycolate dehydrogenase